MLETLVSHLSTIRAPSNISTVGGPSLTDWSSFFWTAAGLMGLALPLLSYRIFVRWRRIEAARRETAPTVAARLVAGPTTLVGVATVEDDCDEDPLVLLSEQTGKRALPADAWIWSESSRRLIEQPFSLLLDGEARRVRVVPDARVKLLALLETGDVTASSEHEAHRRATARLRRGERARIIGVLSFEPAQSGYRGEDREPVLRPAPGERLLVQAVSSAEEVDRTTTQKRIPRLILVLAIILGALALAPALYLRAAGADAAATVDLPRDPRERAVPARLDGIEAPRRIFWFHRHELSSDAANRDVVHVRFAPGWPQLYCLRGQWIWGNWALVFSIPTLLLAIVSFAYFFGAIPGRGPYYDDNEEMTHIINPPRGRARERADS